jgi:dipeptidase D
LRKLKAAFAKVQGEILHEYATAEPDMTITLQEGEVGRYAVLHPSTAAAVMLTLVHMPDGVQRMEPDMPGMVRTSLNMGIIEQEDDTICLRYLIRSSSDSEKHWLEEKARSLAMLFDGDVEVIGEYPGWEYRPDSHVREVMARLYREQTGKEPVICGIHAGLECGIFSAKLPGLDCVSFGPQIADIHTTREILYVDSVQRTWELLLAVLKEL